MPQLLQLPSDAPLPCTQRLYFPAERFFWHACTDVGWTDLRALTALERLYRLSEIPFSVDHAFSDRQPLRGHGSGVCFDLGTDLLQGQRRRLRYLAVASGLFASVATEAASPNCVRVQCLKHPTLRYGAHGVFVFSLQKALREKGYFSGVYSGMFCRETERAVIRFQRAAKLQPTGIADRVLWDCLQRE